MDMRNLLPASDGQFSLHPTWSPDSRQLLVVRGADVHSATDLWVINVDGSQLHQVRHAPAEYGGFAWPS
jgi:Tol biopolymer transport system component